MPHAPKFKVLLAVRQPRPSKSLEPQSSLDSQKDVLSMPTTAVRAQSVHLIHNPYCSSHPSHPVEVSRVSALPRLNPLMALGGGAPLVCAAARYVVGRVAQESFLKNAFRPGMSEATDRTCVGYSVWGRAVLPTSLLLWDL